jgi:hypothetical protein
MIELGVEESIFFATIRAFLRAPLSPTLGVGVGTTNLGDLDLVYNCLYSYSIS